MSRFKVKDIAIYHGPVQGYVLAPGDVVSILEDFNPGYRIKLDTMFSTIEFTAADADLTPYLLSTYPLANSLLDNKASAPHNGLVDQRKERGECQTCGTLLPLSSFGFCSCPKCPEPTAKW